jgi:hypothetical protein
MGTKQADKQRAEKARKLKKHCCDKPQHKMCKRCPRRA